ncbi:MAG: glycosyltransferase family 39 protein [Bdellovibrio sp.]|nr:glycosyltransferase family 39 protein [Bdellovibrio sp.]
MTFTLPKYDSKTWSYITLIFIFFLFLFHIGDQSSPRQGTEGFYLQISKEMFSKKSYLIPYYLGEPHFSKPPLQFWLTTPFYFIFGEGLWSARISIFVITCCLIACTSKLLSRSSSLTSLGIFILFISTFGMIKYSRIYMMDAFFTLFTGIGTLFAYEYFSTKKFSILILSSLLLAASSLIKGPISIIMALASLFAFLLIRRERSLFKAFFRLIIFIIIPASLWYIACSYKFGSQFFDYFFIRENLGKFTARTYSPLVLVQGLFLFSFPLIIPFAVILYRDIKSHTLFKNDLKLFLAICFSVFWIIWIFPAQRSHHYAMPATFFVISYLAVSSFDFPWFTKLINFLSISLSTLAIGTIIFILVYQQFLPMFSTITCYVVLLFLITNICLYFITTGTITLRLTQYTITTLLIWYHIASMMALPIIPNQVREHLVSVDSHTRIGVVYRKPYFVSELLGRSIEPISQPQADQELVSNNYDYLIMPLSAISTSANFQIMNSWYIWKRGLRIGQIIDNLMNNKLAELQESYALFRRKQ